jgi:hypothetical protein
MFGVYTTVPESVRFFGRLSVWPRPSAAIFATDDCSLYAETDPTNIGYSAVRQFDAPRVSHAAGGLFSAVVLQSHDNAFETLLRLASRAIKLPVFRERLAATASAIDSPAIGDWFGYDICRQHGSPRLLVQVDGLRPVELDVAALWLTKTPAQGRFTFRLKQPSAADAGVLGLLLALLSRPVSTAAEAAHAWLDLTPAEQMTAERRLQAYAVLVMASQVREIAPGRLVVPTADLRHFAVRDDDCEQTVYEDTAPDGRAIYCQAPAYFWACPQELRPGLVFLHLPDARTSETTVWQQTIAAGVNLFRSFRAVPKAQPTIETYSQAEVAVVG